MKKIANILFGVPLIAFQCSSDIETVDCGCDCKSGVEIKDAEGVVEFVTKDAFRIIPNYDSISNPSWAYVLCNLSDSLRNKIGVDKLKIRFSGIRKPLCSDISTMQLGAPFVLTKVELVGSLD